MTGLSSFLSIILAPIDPARASGAHDTLIRALGSGLSAFGAFGGLRYTHTSCPYRPFCRRPARVVARRRTNCICAILSQSIIRSTSVSISSNSACWAAISPRRFRTSALRASISSAWLRQTTSLADVAFSALPQQCGFAGAKVWVKKSHTSCRQPTRSARRCPALIVVRFAGGPAAEPAGEHGQ